MNKPIDLYAIYNQSTYKQPWDISYSKRKGSWDLSIWAKTLWHKTIQPQKKFPATKFTLLFIAFKEDHKGMNVTTGHQFWLLVSGMKNTWFHIKIGQSRIGKNTLQLYRSYHRNYTLSCSWDDEADRQKNVVTQCSKIQHIACIEIYSQNGNSVQ